MKEEVEVAEGEEAPEPPTQEELDKECIYIYIYIYILFLDEELNKEKFRPRGTFINHAELKTFAASVSIIKYLLSLPPESKIDYYISSAEIGGNENFDIDMAVI